VREASMNVKVYVSGILNSKATELFDFLDERDISYEVERVGTEWVGSHRVKSLPVVEIDGELMVAKKAMKKLKKG
jgi:predicted thioredoxin/glutaredoxin